MPTSINNAAPMAYMYGIQDNSGAALSVTQNQTPSHCPKVFLFTQKGPTGPQLVGEGATQMFGADTFNPVKPFYTHQTVLSEQFQAAGNAQMIERMTPADAPLPANFTLWLDVLPVAALPVYQRNADGSYVLDNVTGLPKPVTPAQTVAGYKLKWVVDSISAGLATDDPLSIFGKLTSKPGDQVDGATTSTRYPILQFWASSFGSYGNNAGFRVWAPTVNDQPVVDTQLLSALQCYPFRMTAINRVDSNSTAKITPMMSGDTSFEFVLKTNQINPATTGPCSLGVVFPTAYSQNAPGYDPVFADLGGMHIYQSFIDTILAELYIAEVTAGGGQAGSDFAAAETGNPYKVNFMSALSSTAIPYYAVVMNTADVDAISLSSSTNLWAKNGGDGTTSEANLATLVTSRMADYADPNNSLMDTAVNVESIIYDSGFPLATKQALCQFISQRKDTFVVLSTYDVNGAAMTESDEAAMAAGLRTQLQLYPESTYFGTGTCRGLILGRYGTFIPQPTYTKQLPLTIELAAKAAKFMGASNGEWKASALFDYGDNADVTMFKDVNVSWTPAAQRNADWSNGLNYPLSKTRQTLFFPALKTAYGDDTSVLTSFFTTMACVQLEKIGENAWRQFSGVVSLTDAQLIDAVNKYVTEQITGKFANMFKIIPNCTITAADAQRNYTWTLPINIYANGMKTGESVIINAYRMSQAPSN